MTRQFDDIISLYTEKLNRHNRAFNLLGWSKFVALLAMALSLWTAYRNDFTPVYTAVSAALLAGVTGLWIWHVREHNQVLFCRGIIGIGKEYLERIAGGWTAFEDTGGEFVNSEHPYAADLDIVGPKSLFQMISIAHTYHGRQTLARDLMEADYTLPQIEERQRGVRELSEKTEFACTLQYHTARITCGAKILQAIEVLSDQGTAVRSKVARRLLLWLPILSTVLLCAAVLGLRALYGPVAILLAAQTVFWLSGIPRTGRYLAGIMGIPHTFSHYADALKALEGQSFADPALQELREELAGSADSAAKAFAKLDSIVSMARLKGSGIPYLLANILLLWDYRCALALSDWKVRYAHRCEGWFELLGNLESLLSLAGLVNVCEGTCMPTVREKPRMLRAEALGHPLLAGGERICNNVEMRDEIYIISGSNMSGKTTFLRTVGVNLALANAGGPVCATSMECFRFRIAASMRIADDLSGGISTFYAELRKIKNIIELARSRSDLFFLIDEIFRGTNSEDRLYGAGEVIRELSGREIMGLITTHDLSLCSLEQQCPNIRNYSFCEQYAGDQMSFDYRLRQGKSQTTNAKFLMQQVGIVKRP